MKNNLDAIHALLFLKAASAGWRQLLEGAKDKAEGAANNVVDTVSNVGGDVTNRLTESDIPPGLEAAVQHFKEFPNTMPQPSFTNRLENSVNSAVDKGRKLLSPDMLSLGILKAQDKVQDGIDSVRLPLAAAHRQSLGKSDAMTGTAIGGLLGALLGAGDAASDNEGKREEDRKSVFGSVIGGGVSGAGLGLVGGLGVNQMRARDPSAFIDRLRRAQQKNLLIRRINAPQVI